MNTSFQLFPKPFRLAALACIGALLCCPPCLTPAALANSVAPFQRNLVEVTQGKANESGTPLTLKAREPLTLTMKELSWNPKTESMDLETVKFIRSLKKGQTYKFTFLPAGDIPNLALCAKPQSGPERCWKPSFSGRDGSLEMDAGFYLKQ